MSRVIGYVAFAIVLAVAGTGIAAAHGGLAAGPVALDATADVEPTSPTDTNASERLVVADANATTAYANGSVDPAVRTSMSFEHTRADFDAYRLQADIDTVESPDEQIGMVAEEVAALTEELDAMYEIERATYQAFATGDIDGATMTMRLARLHNRATALDDRANELRIAIGSIDARDRRAELNVQRGRLRRVQMDARAFHGPVGDQLVTHVSGETIGYEQLWVASTETGYEVATIRGSMFTREAFVAPNRDRAAGEVFRDSEQGIALSNALYPWTWSNAIGEESDMSGGLFWSSVEHPHGTTVMYIDAATERSFREAHELNLGTLEYSFVAAETTRDATVVVERAFPGGPARVMVDDATGDRVRGAEVAIDGTVVGTTGPDGVLRTVAPVATAEITVETNDTTAPVTVTVSR